MNDQYSEYEETFDDSFEEEILESEKSSQPGIQNKKEKQIEPSNNFLTKQVIQNENQTNIKNDNQANIKHDNQIINNENKSQSYIISQNVNNENSNDKFKDFKNNNELNVQLQQQLQQQKQQYYVQDRFNYQRKEKQESQSLQIKKKKPNLEKQNKGYNKFVEKIFALISQNENKDPFEFHSILQKALSQINNDINLIIQNDQISKQRKVQRSNSVKKLMIQKQEIVNLNKLKLNQMQEIEKIQKRIQQIDYQQMLSEKIQLILKEIKDCKNYIKASQQSVKKGGHSIQHENQNNHKTKDYYEAKSEYYNILDRNQKLKLKLNEINPQVFETQERYESITKKQELALQLANHYNIFDNQSNLISKKKLLDKKIKKEQIQIDHCQKKIYLLQLDIKQISIKIINFQKVINLENDDTSKQDIKINDLLQQNFSKDVKNKLDFIKNQKPLKIEESKDFSIQKLQQNLQINIDKPNKSIIEKPIQEKNQQKQEVIIEETIAQIKEEPQVNKNYLKPFSLKKKDQKQNNTTHQEIQKTSIETEDTVINQGNQNEYQDFINKQPNQNNQKSYLDIKDQGLKLPQQNLSPQPKNELNLDFLEVPKKQEKSFNFSINQKQELNLDFLDNKIEKPVEVMVEQKKQINLFQVNKNRNVQKDDNSIFSNRPEQKQVNLDDLFNNVAPKLNIPEVQNKIENSNFNNKPKQNDLDFLNQPIQKNNELDFLNQPKLKQNELDFLNQPKPKQNELDFLNQPKLKQNELDFLNQPKQRNINNNDLDFLDKPKLRNNDLDFLDKPQLRNNDLDFLDNIDALNNDQKPRRFQMKNKNDNTKTLAQQAENKDFFDEW